MVENVATIIEPIILNVNNFRFIESSRDFVLRCDSLLESPNSDFIMVFGYYAVWRDCLWLTSIRYKPNKSYKYLTLYGFCWMKYKDILR